MDGLEAVEVYNETGLRFTVLLGRGMDIGSASYKGTNLSYLAASGITSAAYYQNGGKEWKHCFTGGLLYLSLIHIFCRISCSVTAWGRSSPAFTFPAMGRD